ncbi:MAG: AAA family ATPase [Syntrophobacter sp.]
MNKGPEKMQKTIAVTGKGGTGKTVLSTLLIKSLVEAGDLSILAVDADSAKSLPYTLGMAVARTVGDFREELITNPAEKQRISQLHMGSVIGEMVMHGPGFDLLVMGRPEAPGCFCTVNDLLRYGIEALSRNYDVTIVDGEAGPEQINRRVMQHLDALLVVADTSIRSLQTAKDIMKVAQGQGIVPDDRIGLIINRFKGVNDKLKEFVRQLDVNIWGYIPDDKNISTYDSLNRALLDLPKESPSLSAIPKIMEHIW